MYSRYTVVTEAHAENKENGHMKGSLILSLVTFACGLEVPAWEGDENKSGVSAIHALCVLCLYCSLWDASAKTDLYEKRKRI